MKVFKRAIPILIGSVVVATVVSTIPFNEVGEASKYDYATKVDREVKRDIKKVKEKYISLDEAMEIAMKKVGNKHSEVTDYSIYLGPRDPHFLIEITTTNNPNKYKVYEIKVDGISGKILDEKVEEVKAKEEKVKTNNGRFISKYEAKTAALEEVNAKKAFVTGFEIKLHEKTPNYLVEVKHAKYRYIIKVDAENGNILDVTKEVRDKDDKDKYNKHEYKIRGNSDKINKDKKEKEHKKEHKKENKKENKKPVMNVKFITKEEAIKVALKKIGKKAELDEIEFEKDDNPPKYEIEMYDDKYEYEIEIHAISGAILEFERNK